MANEEIKITELLGVKSPDWAKEVTLQQVAKNTKASYQVLKQIALVTAKGDAALEAELNKIAVGLGEVAEVVETGSKGAQRQASTEGGLLRKSVNWLGNKIQNVWDSASITNSISSLNSVLKSGLTAQGGLSSVLSSLSSNAKYVSADFKEQHPQLAKLSIATGLVIEGFNILVTEVMKQNDEMRKLYSNGILVSNGFVGLADAASSLGVSASEAVEVLTKFNKVAVGMGTAELTKMMVQVKRSTKDFSEFRMSNKEALEAIGDTLDTLQSYGVLRNMTDDQRNKFTKDYIIQLNDLATVTGRNRDELRKQLNQYAKTTNAFLTMQMLPKEVRENFQKITNSVMASFGPAGEKLMDELGNYLAGGVGMMSEEYQYLFTKLGRGSGDILKELAEAARTGNVEAAEIAKGKLVDMIGEMTPEQARILKLMAKQNPAFAQLINELTQSSKAEKDRRERYKNMTVEERKIAEANEKIEKDRLARETEAINKTNAAMNTLANEFRKLVAEMSPGLIEAMKSLASVVTTVVDLFNGMTKSFQRFFQSIGLNKNQSSVAAAISSVVVVAIVGKVLKALVTGGIWTMFSALTDRVVKMFHPKTLNDKFRDAASAGGGRKGPAIPEPPTGPSARSRGSLRSFLKLMSITNIAKAAAGLALLTGAIYLSAIAFKKFNEVNWESLPKAGVAIAELAVSAALASKLIGNPAQFVLRAGALAIGIGSIGLALWGAAKGLEVLEKVSWETFAKAGVAIAGIGAAIAGAGMLAVPILVGSGVIAGSIVVIGAAIAGASWILGKTLPTLTEGLEKFSKLDGDALISAGKGMSMIGVGLTALTAGNIIHGIGSLASGFLSLFASDPIAQLKRFAEIGAPLNIAADAMQKLADSFPRVSLAMNGIMDITKIFSSGFFEGIFGSSIDQSKIQSFIKLFDTLSKSKASITEGAQTIEILANTNITEEKIKSLQTLSGMFSSNWFGDLFASKINETKITDFVKIFELIGKQRKQIVEGVETISSMTNSNITEEKIKALQTLSGMFSSNWFGDLFSVFGSRVSENKVSDFFKVFELIGKHKQNIVSGVDTLSAMTSANFTEDKMKAIQTLSNMFSTNWFTDLFRSKIDTAQVDAFAKLLATLGSRSEDWKNGMQSIKNLMDIPIDENKMKGLQLLSEMFSTSWFKNLWQGEIKTELVDSFGKMMNTLSQHKGEFSTGKSAINELLSVAIDQTKVESLKLLSSMFSSSWFSSMFTNDYDTKQVKSFAGMFEEFGKHKDNFVKGSQSLAALMAANLEPAKIEGIQKFMDLFKNDFVKKISPIDTSQGIFGILNLFSSNKELVDKAVLSLNQFSTIDTTKGLFAILNAFATNKDSIDKAVTGLNQLLSMDPAKFATFFKNQLVEIDSSKGIFGILNSFTTNKESIERAVTTINQLLSINFDKLSAFSKSQSVDVDTTKGIFGILNVLANKKEMVDKAILSFNQFTTVDTTKGLFAILNAFATNKNIIDNTVTGLNQLVSFDFSKFATFSRNQSVDIDPNKGIFGILNLLASKKEIIDKAISSLNQFTTVDTTKGLFAILNAFATNKNIIDNAVTGLNQLVNIDAAKLATFFKNQSVDIDPNKGIFGILNAFATSKESIERAITAINQLLNIDFDKFASFAKSNLTDIDPNKGIFGILNLLANKKEIIDKAISSLNQFTTIDTTKGIFGILNAFSTNKESIERAIAAINQLINIDANKLATNIDRLRQILPQLTNQASSTSTATPASVPVITTDQLNLKTLQYYDDSIRKMKEVVNALETIHEDLDRMRVGNDVNSGKLVDAISRSGQQIR